MLNSVSRGLCDLGIWCTQRQKKLAKRRAGIKYDNYRKAPNANAKERHLPGYNYCGPGTDVAGRLERGDRGVNFLDDQGCRLHDVDYMRYYGDNEKLKEADKRLVEIGDSEGYLSGIAVATTFRMKDVLENIGIIDPSKFAKGLESSGADSSEVIKKGLELYESYIKDTLVELN